MRLGILAKLYNAGENIPALIEKCPSLYSIYHHSIAGTMQSNRTVTAGKAAPVVEVSM